MPQHNEGSSIFLKQLFMCLSFFFCNGYLITVNILLLFLGCIRKQCNYVFARTKKKKHTCIDNDAMKKAMAELNRPSDEFEIFGEYVASELRSLQYDHNKRKLKRIIQKAIPAQWFSANALGLRSRVRIVAWVWMFSGVFSDLPRR